MPTTVTTAKGALVSTVNCIEPVPFVSGLFKLPILGNGRPYVFAFFYFLNFFLYFSRFLRNWTVDQDQDWGKDNPYLDGFEVKFQQDLLRGFARRSILPHS